MPTVGSLHNLMANQSVQAYADTPEVGDGATIVRYTDRDAATVVEVLSATRVRIQWDKVEFEYPHGGAKSIERDPDGKVIEVRRGRDGRWALLGQRDTTVMFGVRAPYYDYNF